MKLEMVDPTTLKPAPWNPKRITDRALKRLAKILDTHGFVEPLVARKEDRLLLGGHQRLKANRLRAEPATRIPVVWMEGLDDATAKSITIALSNREAQGEEDREKLVALLNDIAGQGVDLLPFTGYTAEELIEMQTVDAGAKRSVDDAPEPPKGKAKSKPGRLYAMGEHRLMVGDATNPDDVAKLMGKAKADLLITDPPYNVDYTGKTKQALKIQNDTMDRGKFLRFLVDALTNAATHTKRGGAFYIWHADSEGRTFREAADTAGWDTKQCLIGVKTTMVLGRQDYQWKHEPCLYGWKPGASHTWNADRKQTTLVRFKADGWDLIKTGDGYSVTINDQTYHITGKELKISRVHTSTLQFEKPAANVDHPTMKPVSVIEYQIRNSTKAGQLCLDLFAGSGTTVIAAELAGRRAAVLELDPRYADVVRRRWAEHVHGKGCDWQKLTPEAPEAPAETKP